MHLTTPSFLTLAAVLVIVSCDGKQSATLAGSDGAGGGSERQGLSEADRILRGAHFMTALPQLEVSGQLRKNGRRLPIGLTRRDGDLEFAYQNPEEGGAVRIHTRMKGRQYEMFELVGGKAWQCSPGRLGESIAGTDFSHEDLMMPWLLWPGGELRGEERLEGRGTWRLRVANPDPVGPTREVEVWVDQRTGGLLRAVLSDDEGRPLKQFRVLDVQQVEAGGYAVRRGRLDRLDPETREVVGCSYLEFDSPRLVGSAK